MIELAKDIRRIPQLVIANFFLDQLIQLSAQIVGRNHQFLKLDRHIRLFDKFKQAFDILDDRQSCRELQKVRISTSVPFMEISRGDTSDVSFFCDNERDLGMDL